MTLKYHFFLHIAINLVLVAVIDASITSNSLPNFVIMMADDMGYGDWSRTGAPAHTPHLDEMSHSTHTVWFQRAYAGNPICSPTRASVITGRTPSRTCIYGVEQHILCRDNTAGLKGGCTAGEFSIANATRLKGYMSGFYGKWHLGSLRNSTSDCYPATNITKPHCLPGYVSYTNGNEAVCCQGNDGHLMISHPLHFGFDRFVATPQCAPSATTNCGCFFYPHAHNDSQCIVGHYNKSCSTCDKHLECGQYYVGSVDGDGIPSIEALSTVSAADDEDFLISQLEKLIVDSLAEGKPFLGVVFFHGSHIPYVATPEHRAPYAEMGMDMNEQDYWGTITQIDAAVGRVRALLKHYKIDNNTWVSITADNGPEVSPANGQGTGTPFINPGRTDGLRGRKRDLTEGGIREIGLVEFPPEIKENRVEKRYPVVTMDYMATILDVLGMSPYQNRPLDGTSLLPFFRNQTKERASPIGWYGIFKFGSTDHINGTFPHKCPAYSNARKLGDVPANFTTPGRQPQWAWAEGNRYKLFGCVGVEDKQWHFFMYDLDADRKEQTDIWNAHQKLAQQMFSRFLKWQESVIHSQGVTENGCANPMPIVKYNAIPGLQNKKERCTSKGDNFLGESSAETIEACAQDCFYHSDHRCRDFSFSKECGCCWMFQSCNQTESGAYVYNWSSFQMIESSHINKLAPTSWNVWTPPYVEMAPWSNF